jgi:hypothetical protein
MSQPKLTSHKDMRKLIRQAEAQGWVVKYGGGGHLKFLAPGGGIVVSPGTASDYRSMRNHVALMKRLGFEPGGRS